MSNHTDPIPLPEPYKEETTYSQRIHWEYSKEHPDYFSCTTRDVPRLVEKSKQEAEKILRDFSEFYVGDIGIEIGTKRHGICWSITGTLTVNGNKVKEYDPCDLCFLDLNMLMMKRMIDCGMVSFGGEKMAMSDSCDKRCRDCYYSTNRTENTFVCRKRYFDIDNKTCFKQREVHEASDADGEIETDPMPLPEPYREEEEP